jgi:hypothetical protein
MNSNLLKSDPFYIVKIFENAIYNFCGAKYRIATDHNLQKMSYNERLRGILWLKMIITNFF